MFLHGWTQSLRSVHAGGAADRGVAAGRRVYEWAGGIGSGGADGVVVAPATTGSEDRRGGAVLAADGAAAERSWGWSSSEPARSLTFGAVRRPCAVVSAAGRFCPEPVRVGIGVVTTVGVERFHEGDLAADLEDRAIGRFSGSPRRSERCR